MPVAGKTIHVSGQSPVSMVRSRSKSNRSISRTCISREAVVRGTSPGSDTSSWRVWGQKPGQPALGYQKNFHEPKRGKIQMFQDKKHWYARIAVRNSSLRPASRSFTRRKGSRMSLSAAKTAAPAARPRAATIARCSMRSARNAGRQPRSRSNPETTVPCIAATASRTTSANAFPLFRSRI